jgi:hypothetical protein
MTRKTDQRPEKPRKIDPQYGDALLGRFYSSADPEHLAQFIEEGGTLTNGLRDLLAKLVRDHLPTLRNKSDPLRDLVVFDQVEAWRKAQVTAPVYEHIKKNNLSPIEALSAFNKIRRNRCPSLQEAYRHFTDNDDSIEPETFQKQYERGRNIAKGRM